MNGTDSRQSQTGMAATRVPLSDIATTALRSRISALRDRLSETAGASRQRERALLKLLISQSLNDLGRGQEAWDIGWEAFQYFVHIHDWPSAIETCDSLYQSGQAQAISALAQGIWLALNSPADGETASVLLLHLLQEFPDKSDQAALIASTVLYFAVSRAESHKRGQLIRMAGRALIGVAAQRGIEDTATFERWLHREGLDHPGTFLPQLQTLIHSLVQDEWWFDQKQVETEIALH